MILHAKSMVHACMLSVLSLAASATSLAESSPVPRGSDRLEEAGRSLRLTFDKAGPLGQIDIHDGDKWHPLMDQGSLPAIQLHADRQILVPGSSWKTSSLHPSSHHPRRRIETSFIDTEGKTTPWSLELVYEFFPEGALFIDFTIGYRGPANTSLEKIVVSLPNTPARTFKKFTATQPAKATPAFLPVRWTLGNNASDNFTNEVEIIMEDRLGPNGQPGDFSSTSDLLEWTFSGPSKPIVWNPLKIFSYRNRLALGASRAPTSTEDASGWGARVFHWVNVLDVENWFPTPEEVALMAERGATHLILHHEWMRYRGNNGFPPADYEQVRDVDALKETVKAARSHGIQVGLYIRGVEKYALESPVFTDPKLFDGIYVDWHGAQGHSHHEAVGPPAAVYGDRHFSLAGTYIPARDYFLFGRKLRQLVGPEGFLMGHAGSFNSGILGNLNFDAYIAGETQSERELFRDRDHAVYLGMMTSAITMPWPEEAGVFSEPEGAAKMAAWGMFPHLILGLKNPNTGALFPRAPDARVNESVFSYWNLLRNFDFSDVRVVNHPAAPHTHIESSDPKIQSIAYLNQKNSKTLLIVANLDSQPRSAVLAFGATLPEPLRLPQTILSVQRSTGPGAVSSLVGHKLTTPLLQPWEILAVELQPTKAPQSKP